MENDDHDLKEWLSANLHSKVVKKVLRQLNIGADLEWRRRRWLAWLL